MPTRHRLPFPIQEGSLAHRYRTFATNSSQVLRRSSGSVRPSPKKGRRQCPTLNWRAIGIVGWLWGAGVATIRHQPNGSPSSDPIPTLRTFQVWRWAAFLSGPEESTRPLANKFGRSLGRRYQCERRFLSAQYRRWCCQTYRTRQSPRECP